MVDFLVDVLAGQYGLSVRRVEEVAGGWSAAAFVVHADGGKYFAKIYDRHRSSVRPWIARMDAYMPAVRWLSEHTPMRDGMVAPILTKNGDDRARDAGFVAVVFPFVEGQTLYDTRLSVAQFSQLAELLVLLHSCGGVIPVSKQPPVEGFSLPFLDGLEPLVCWEDIPPVLREAIDPHAATLRGATDALRRLAKQLLGNPPPCALCHTDLHGGNLMWGKRLVLLDWEGLRMAPVEADLFAFSDGFFFDYARDAFFAAYRRARPDYDVDQTAMQFYRLRRRMEDVAEFCDSIMQDDLDSAALEEALSGLRTECAALDDMVGC